MLKLSALRLIVRPARVCALRAPASAAFRVSPGSFANKRYSFRGGSLPIVVQRHFAAGKLGLLPYDTFKFYVLHFASSGICVFRACPCFADGVLAPEKPWVLPSAAPVGDTLKQYSRDLTVRLHLALTGGFEWSRFLGHQRARGASGSVACYVGRGVVRRVWCNVPRRRWLWCG